MTSARERKSVLADGRLEFLAPWRTMDAQFAPIGGPIMAGRAGEAALTPAVIVVWVEQTLPGGQRISVRQRRPQLDVFEMRRYHGRARGA